jgi:hypothetical protein
MNPRLQRAIDSETADLARITANITRAWENGLISEHDRDERIARREHWTEGRIAHLKGERAPRMRERQPLDDENAGRVG